MRFSQRIGKKPIKDVLQLESIDIELKNRLWNVILESFFNQLSTTEYSKGSPKMQVCMHIWREFYNNAVDQFPRAPLANRPSIASFMEHIRAWYFQAEWDQIYDFVEELARIEDSSNLNLEFIQNCNRALKKELSGYRIVNNRVVQITAEEEIAEVEEALVNTDKWSSVRTHLGSAITYLADKSSPNYRNSIKESISAVEALCKIITGDDQATLGKALAVIEREHNIHGALKSAFSAIYGYTSDSGGIRHALLETDTPVDTDEAKFMLISCSAFINYLISKSS